MQVSVADLSSNTASITHSWKGVSHLGMLAENTCKKYVDLCVHLPPCKNSRPDEWIFTKFYMGNFFCLCLPHAFMMVSCSDYSSTLKMENVCSSETSVDFQRTTRRYIPEDTTLLQSQIFYTGFTCGSTYTPRETSGKWLNMGVIQMKSVRRAANEYSWRKIVMYVAH
jgi:hypothetical protein